MARQWPYIAQSNYVHILRHLLELSQEGFAGLMGVTTRTIVRVERRDQIPAKLKKSLVNLGRVLIELDPKLKQDPEVVVRWLKAPFVGMRNYKPIELITSDYSTEILLEKISEDDNI